MRRAAACLTLLAGVVVAVLPPARAEITASDRLSPAQVAHGTGEMQADGPGAIGSIAVATFNVCVCLSTPAARADAAKLADVAALDVIGWQEANQHPGVYRSLPGWTTVQDMRTSTKWHELAVSWRTDEFVLVDHTYTRMHLGSSSTRGTSTVFPSRWLLTVRLRPVSAPDQVLTVYDTHTNQHVERWETGAPGRPYANLNADRARTHLRSLEATLSSRAQDPGRSRWAVLTGDLNWDFVADQRTLAPNFVESRVGEWAVSSWESMGVADRPWTHPRSRRRIDYVFLPRDSVAHFRRQSVRTGYHSDHRPVITWLGLD